MVSLQDECRKVLEQVELYLDGELGAIERVQVHLHLERCGPCTDHSEFQRRLKELLRSTCGCDEVPSQLLERIRSTYTSPEP
ncbi:MAG TPA: mycothiol system anti-sigma-R factor [Actinomycetota bacterium]|nr:mycothiol system anti-sigma-R factor [Actinomycetota bacterium]